jgi:hypothetical protein
MLADTLLTGQCVLFDWHIATQQSKVPTASKQSLRMGQLVTWYVATRWQSFFFMSLLPGNAGELWVTVEIFYQPLLHRVCGVGTPRYID